MNKLPIHSCRHKNVSLKHGIYEPHRWNGGDWKRESCFAIFKTQCNWKRGWKDYNEADYCLRNRIFALNYMLWRQRCRFLLQFLLGEPKVNSKITFFSASLWKRDWGASGKVWNLNPPYNRIMYHAIRIITTLWRTQGANRYTAHCECDKNKTQKWRRQRINTSQPGIWINQLSAEGNFVLPSVP